MLWRGCALVGVLAASLAHADIPVGRFMQDSPMGYRDIRIADDGKTAVWLTRECPLCGEAASKPKKVVALTNGVILMGDTELQVISPRMLRHVLMGNFSKDSLQRPARQ